LRVTVEPWFRDAIGCFNIISPLFSEVSFPAGYFLNLFEAHSLLWLSRLRPGCCRNGTVRESLAFERSKNAGSFG